jgi:hypothetical protein
VSPSFVAYFNSLTLSLRPSEGSKAHLEALCKRFKQPHTAPNKAALVARLKEFSQHKEKWERYGVYFLSHLHLPSCLTCRARSILPGAHRAHRGPRSGTKSSTSAKKSAQRRVVLFPPPNITHSAPAVDTSDDRRTQEEIENILPWVSVRLVLSSSLPAHRLSSGKDDRHDVPVPASTLVCDGHLRRACHSNTGPWPRCRSC